MKYISKSDADLLSEYIEALGLLASLAPKMVLDVNDPLGMAKQIETKVLKERIDGSSLDPLYYPLTPKDAWRKFLAKPNNLRAWEDSEDKLVLLYLWIQNNVINPNQFSGAIYTFL